MKFEWHPPKAERNLVYHGVSFEEAATVFDDPLADIQPDLLHSIEEARFLALGTSSAGQLLLVVFTERPGVIRIISARSDAARKKEL